MTRATRAAASSEQRTKGESGHQQPQGPPRATLVLRATAPVWVCLIDARNRTLLDGVTLAPGAEEGPFESGRFIVAFGNGGFEMLINGERAQTQTDPNPVGYRIGAAAGSPSCPRGSGRTAREHRGGERRGGATVRAGIVVTGTEVLTGRIADANGPWLSERLAELGVEVAHIMVVADRPDDLRAALAFLAGEGIDLIVTSGGLGPTADDLTAQVVADFTGREMVLDEAMEGRIEAILRAFARRRKFDVEAMRAANRKQAMVPDRRGGARSDRNCSGPRRPGR